MSLNPYDRVVDEYEDARAGFREKEFVDAILPDPGSELDILDLGCGTGFPIARYLLARGHRVTGVDSSLEMLRRARKRVPDARLVCADARDVEFREESFDRIVAWDSLFHLPRDDHADIYRRMFEWLRPGGRTLLSCGGSAWEGTAPMFGEEFFFSGHEPDRARALLEDAGFRIDRWEVDDPSSRGHIAGLVTRPDV